MTKTKRLPSELLTTGGRTQQLPPAAVNSQAARGQHSTRSVKTGNTPTSTHNSSVTLSSLTGSEKENALLTAGVFASTLGAMLHYGMVRKARNMRTGEIMLVFPSTVWTDDLRLMDDQ